MGFPCYTNNETVREFWARGARVLTEVTNLTICGSHFEPPLFPIFLKLARRRCLVVGASALAEPKIEGLLYARANVRVVAPRASQRVQQWAREGTIKWQARRFEARDLSKTFLVVAATPSSAANKMVFETASDQGILCNAVDDRQHCNFYYPAVVRRRRLQIAISTGGASPALAQRLRRQLEEQFGPEYEVWLDWLAESRRSLLELPLRLTRRNLLLHQIASQRSLKTFLRKNRTAGSAERGK